MSYAALLGFAPFAVFALIEKWVGIVPGLVAGLLVSLGLATWTALRHRSANMLELGSAVIFGALAALALSVHPAWSVWDVRLYVDAGLALVVILGVLLRRPFTLQHRKTVDPTGITRDPAVLRRHLVLSGVWGLAFAGLALVDLYMTLDPGVRDRRGIILTLAILLAAARVTHASVKHARAVA
ncbi:hypothetical protein [Solimonas marina]|uniref:Intracellular septation protein A n=1 Tax=Solimonas marina TaxID=2714601 RepID=A0A969W7G6_9GAMM|nr:hypothetical protein [Solimonas marina]NKF22022.1 hypothetical protein [Solimonas marina]